MLSTLLGPPSRSPSPPSRLQDRSENGTDLRPPSPSSPSTILSTSNGALVPFNPSYVPSSHGIPGGLLTYRPRPRSGLMLENGERKLSRTERALDDDGDHDGLETTGEGKANEIKLTVRLPNPEKSGEGGTALFAQYVWNAGVLGAELILGLDDAEDDHGQVSPSQIEAEKKPFRRKWRKRWEVQRQTVLELGAGTALPSLMCSLLPSVQSITISDYPSASLIETIRSNVALNVPVCLQGNNRVRVVEHLWGSVPAESDLKSEALAENAPPSKAAVAPSSPSSIAASTAEAVIEGQGSQEYSEFVVTHKQYFTRIIITDTIWLFSEHEKLVRSLAWFLKRRQPHPHEERREKKEEAEDTANTELESDSLIYLTAGYHTGLRTIISFFHTAHAVAGLKVRDIWQIDTAFQIAECEWWRVEGSSNSSSGSSFSIDEEQLHQYEKIGGERERWTICAVLSF